MRHAFILLSVAVLWARTAFTEDKTDIEYGRADGERLLLDAHIPDETGPRPTVMIVHGGGWTSGDKQKDIDGLFAPLSKAGFTWFSINYRLAPAHHWPACFEDVQTALRWAKSHATEFKSDPHRLALLGYSAGGQLACLAAVLAKPDAEVQAVVGFAPPTDLVADTERRGGLSKSLQALFGQATVNDIVQGLLKDLSPINHVRPGLPPFLLVHGDADKTVSLQQSLNFQARLRDKGVVCDLITIKGAPHRLSDWNQLDASYQDKLVSWLNEKLGSNKSLSRKE